MAKTVKHMFEYQGKTYTFEGEGREVANLKKMIATFESKMEENYLPKSVKRGRGRPAVERTPSQVQVIRAWAVEQGLPVGKRGRLHPDVLTAYEAAH